MVQMGSSNEPRTLASAPRSQQPATPIRQFGKGHAAWFAKFVLACHLPLATDHRVNSVQQEGMNVRRRRRTR